MSTATKSIRKERWKSEKRELEKKFEIDEANAVERKSQNKKNAEKTARKIFLERN